jgi:Fe-S-cluster containining protein
VKRSRSEVGDSVLDEVRGVYRVLQQRPVERTCIRRTDCCRFRLTGKVPYLTRGEAMVAAHSVRRIGRTKLPARDDGACPLLDAEGKCLIYEGRPFGCRTHFCDAAGGAYGRAGVLDLIRRLEEIDQRLGGDGGRPLPTAVAWALRNLE